MPSKREIATALEIGRAGARRVLDDRAERLAQRAVALEAASHTERGVTSLRAGDAAARVATAASVFAQTAGVLVAEGDSWFDYPLHDVLEELEDRNGYDVESVAHMGDRIEDMAYSAPTYGGGQLREFTRRIEKLLGRGIVPRAVLVSGGGNDVAGDELAFLLNHAASAEPGLNPSIVDGVIGRVQLSYVTILSAVTRVCEERLGRPLPILVHGYDYAVPDGRGFLGGFWLLPGPWLEPSFRAKGYMDLAERKRIVRILIDRLNVMLDQVSRLAEFGHVHYVDLRNTLPTGADYQDWWANELHPTPTGFGAVAKRIADVLAQL